MTKMYNLSAYFGTYDLAGFFGRKSGWTKNSICGNPVPKYEPSDRRCLVERGKYTSQQHGQYSRTTVSPATSDSPKIRLNSFSL